MTGPGAGAQSERSLPILDRAEHDRLRYKLEGLPTRSLEEIRHDPATPWTDRLVVGAILADRFYAESFGGAYPHLLAAIDQVFDPELLDGMHREIRDGWWDLHGVHRHVDLTAAGRTRLLARIAMRRQSLLMVHGIRPGMEVIPLRRPPPAPLGAR